MLYHLTVSKDIFRLHSSSKSRRDGILLTVGFNLRMRNTNQHLGSPAWDDTCIIFTRDDNVSSHAGLVCVCAASVVRRLKSTVNKVPSLRDFHGNVL